MDRSQELNTSAGGNVMLGGESEPEMTCSMTRKVSLLTESELRKVEVQKVEGELTIKRLEREYHEAKKNFYYSQKKLGEARKKAANQAESVSQLIGANKAIVEKFNELRNYQNEIVLSNVEEVEKTSVSCRGKNAELTNALQMILEQQNYLERLEKEIHDKKVVVNNDIKREIEKEKVVCASLNETLSESKQKVQRIKASLNDETVNYNNVKALLDERVKRAAELEADEEAFQKKAKQEIEALNQEKVKFQDFYNNNVKICEDKIIAVSELRSELSNIQQSKHATNELLKTLESKKEELLKEVTSKRQIVNSSKKILDENMKKINEDLAKVNADLEAARGKFLENEENQQNNLKNLYEKLNEKKTLSKQLEDQQRKLAKLRETKLSKQKALSNTERELQHKADEWASEIRKYEQILSDKNRAQNELETKVKKLQEENNGLKLKLESLNKDKGDKPGNNSIQLGDINTNKPSEINKKDFDVNYKKVPQVKTATSAQLNNSFGFDDSDESEDDTRSKYTTPKRVESKTMASKRSEYDYDSDNSNSSTKVQNNHSVSDRLFDELLSQKSNNPEISSDTSKGSKDADVFKMPQPYSTPFKKKYLPKNYKK